MDRYLSFEHSAIICGAERWFGVERVGHSKEEWDKNKPLIAGWLINFWHRLLCTNMIFLSRTIRVSQCEEKDES
jgi:hypothetical protein